MKRANVPAEVLPILAKPTGQLPVAAWLLALAFAALAAFLLPRQSPFPYSFQLDQPWTYHALKAPFDFEVLYPEEQVRPAIERINAEHSAYLILDNGIAQRQKQRFEQLLDEQIRISGHDAQYDELRANAGTYLRFGQQMLDLLYNQGIADGSDAIFQNTPGFVFVVNGNSERRVEVRNLLTVASANSFLTDTLPYAPLRQPELVLPMLEKVLLPNLRASDSLTEISRRHKLAAAMSTGITVHRGEVIVERNQLVSNAIYLKLQSLIRRYDAPKGWEAVAGYALLAWLAFMAFFFWFKTYYRDQWLSREALLLPPVLMLITIAGIGLGSRLGLAVPLLLPVWALPLLLRRAYDRAIGWAAWAVVVFLTTVALDWSAGWLTVQVAGMLGMVLLLQPGLAWQFRLLAVVGIASLQFLAGLASGWTGKIPDALWTSDTVLFLFVAAAFALLAYPLGNFVAGQLKKVVVEEVEAVEEEGD